ncbi:hypothetical protein BVC80_1117g78 [Macleaya cordata]|uniref:Uncharacterized protein n=1 Tax=Macleaya cordata TaxID=56857 RepID=A0A200Q9D6_MACCD|nr:hypothetical protein BVC80_1117g78 [Macleaya cordata]
MKNIIDEASDDHHQHQRNRYGYERLGSITDDHEPTVGILQSKMSKSLRCLPVFGSTKSAKSSRLAPEVTTTTPTTLTKSQSARQAGSQGNNKKLVKTHPLFNISDLRRSKKAMAKPEFLRYMEYIKEGGTWNPDSNNPVIYFK